MNDHDREVRELADAAAVRAARREMDQAIAHLAASPLEVGAADQMKAVLSGPKLKQARSAMRRLARSTASHRTSALRVVDKEGQPAPTDSGDADDEVGIAALTVVMGGAA